MTIKSKSIVYYVMGANNIDESQLSPPLTQNKKQLEKFGWKIFYGLILNRSSIKGIIKSFWRILRCNPFSKGGYDPIKKLNIK